MKIDESKYSIAEIVEWSTSRQLVANPEYQRGGGLWPNAAKSYFIDTIVREFPFPKVYFNERLDQGTKRVRREIVDGQQRVGTIVAFVHGDFALGSNAREFAGRRFQDFDQDAQETFLSYPVTVDVIRNAARAEILQMFRRMNAFTLPLNAAEKRHSEFFGLFKDWVNVQLDRFGPMLIEWGVLTSRQIVRMADAEFIADVALAIEEGIVSTSPAKLRSMYERYDEVFNNPEMQERLPAALEITQTALSGVQGTFIVRPHVFHSLHCALLHNRFGLPGAEAATGLAPTGAFFVNAERAIAGLRRLGAAHEEKEEGPLSEYVQAASEGGNRASQRATRIKWLLRALRGELPV